MNEEMKEESKALPAWYENLSYSDAKTFIASNMRSAMRSFIAIGFYLKHIRDERFYLEDGYADIWEFSAAEYGISKSTTSRYMKMNDRFSVNGNSPVISEQYRDYEKSKLQEMLMLTDAELEQVTPDMRVRDIRELRMPKKESYFEIEGHLDFGTDFPEIMPDPEPKLLTEPQVFDMDVSDMIVGNTGEPVAISQQPENTGLCMHRPEFPCTLPESSKNHPGDGTDCMHSCCWDCVKHGECKLECYASAQRPELQKEQQNPVDRCQKAAEQLSAYGTLKKVYPKGSLIATEACEGGHTCFSCAMECQIRGDDRYCRYAPLGNPFSCETMKNIGVLREEVGDRCQFINHDLAEHYAGSGEACPCCKNCADPCEYICERAMKKQGTKHEVQTEPQDEKIPDPDDNAINAEFTEVEEPTLDNLESVRAVLRKESAELDSWLEAFKGEPTDQIPAVVEQKKIVVAALASMLSDLENTEPLEEMERQRAEQAKLPAMKNNDQRKEFLDTFRDWPVWFKVPEASEVYYRYDLADRTALVICEYKYYAEWMKKFRYGDGNPDRTDTREYILTPGYHYLHDCRSSRTLMIEKLKEIQKKG